MIRLRSVSVEIEGRSILKDVTLDLTEQRVGIIGLNGSGKSTFVRLLNGLQLPTEGSVTVDELETKKDSRKVRRKVGFVFQNPENQIVYPIVKEDLAFGLKNLKVDKKKTEERVFATLKKYDLAHLSDRFTHQLSGGEKQMIALMGVMIMDPEYIVFDEPTTLLDLRNTRRLMSVIAGLSQSVLMVTHDLDLLSKFDRVLCFQEGQLVADDRPERVIQQYKTLCDV
ncbi:MAG: ABC transporter ATP-binding protein [Sneathiella sp.]|nr:ABC transporter ATP-binding protein [Sneathiella sp.]